MGTLRKWGRGHSRDPFPTGYAPRGWVAVDVLLFPENSYRGRCPVSSANFLVRPLRSGKPVAKASTACWQSLRWTMSQVFVLPAEGRW